MAQPDIRRPVIALAMGDPAGISPELTARLLALDEIRAAVRFVVFGDRRILDAGARTAGVELDLEVTTEAKAPGDRPVLIDLRHLDPADVTPREATLAGGKFASENFRRALKLAAARQVAGVFEVRNELKVDE